MSQSYVLHLYRGLLDLALLLPSPLPLLCVLAGAHKPLQRNVNCCSFLNLLNTRDCLHPHYLPAMHEFIWRYLCTPAFTAQILDAFLFESCSTLTSLLCLGCSHIVFNLAGVVSLASKIPGFILGLAYTLVECFMPNLKHHVACYQEAKISLLVVRSVVVQPEIS